jgi:glycosyltransferase involved in cell wall biosynthesis
MLEASGLEINRIEATASSSPDLKMHAEQNETLYETTIFAVAPDQLMFEMMSLGLAKFSRHRRIGFWYWELECLTPTIQRATNLVDEIWVGSQWIGEVFRSQSDRVVVDVPITAPLLSSSTFDRARLGIGEDSIVFLVTFDYFSVIARKNPMAALEAFLTAFPVPGNAVLLVKSQNGSRLPEDQAFLESRSPIRPDVIFLDEHLSDHDQSGLISMCDVLVSLHRSEGLGLHLLEAATLGKPVIFTDYSGPTEFLNLDNAAPVDFTYVNVRNGKGVYSEGARWAEPDIEHAANWMRLLAHDVDLRRSIGSNARATVHALPSLSDAGSALASRVGVR